jgi:hypothetical protein
MEIFVFASADFTSVNAYTSDATGANLPASYAPWRRARSMRVLGLRSLSPKVADTIVNDGYFLLFGALGQQSGR